MVPEDPEEAEGNGMTARLIPTFWIMHTVDGWYPIQPSDRCKAEDHGQLNPHVVRISDADGNVLWTRKEALH